MYDIQTGAMEEGWKEIVLGVSPLEFVEAMASRMRNSDNDEEMTRTNLSLTRGHRT